MLSICHARLINGETTDAIYGKDDREFVDQTSLKSLISLSQSVALIVSKDSVKQLEVNLSDEASIVAPTLQENQSLCKDEPHAKSPSINGCTGFLVHEDILLTAGHCFFDEADCQEKKFIFGITKNRVELFQAENKPIYRTKTEQIFSCKKIIAMTSLGDSLDYALVQLDRKAKGKIPFKINMHGEFDQKMKVFMLGHPLGMPLMKTSIVDVTQINQHEQYVGENFFLAPFDSFMGNSGGPVINRKTLAVEGMLVSGQDDFVLDSKLNCLRYQVYSEVKAGEVVQRLSALRSLQKYFLRSK